MKRLFSFLAMGAILLASCSKPPTHEQWDTFYKQPVNWGACHPTVLNADPIVNGERTAQQIYQALGDRLECADIKAPLDWTSSHSLPINVPLMRVKASNPSNRQGAIFFNPGGPGKDGLGMGAYYAYAWSKAQPKNLSQESTLATQFNQLTEEFDFIGFSPRGVGDSIRLSCGMNAWTPSYYNASEDRSDENINRIKEVGQLQAKACQRVPYASYINTDATVRDMNLVRHLLGEEKLNYIGFSYGTWLGSWYAKVFPKSTGRMILDGNMKWNGTMEENWSQDPKMYHRTLDEVTFPYFARRDDFFKLGKNKDLIHEKVNNLDKALRTVYSKRAIEYLFDSQNYIEFGVFTKSAVVLDEILKKNSGKIEDREPASQINTVPITQIEQAIEKETFFTEAFQNARAIQFAKEMLMARQELITHQTTPTNYSANDGTLMAVMCNDTRWNQNLSKWRTLDDENATKYKLFGGDLLRLPCLYWENTGHVVQPFVNNMWPVLMIQNEYDPITPRENIDRNAVIASKSHAIMINGEASHTAFPYGTDCVDTPVLTYLLTGELPKGEDPYTSCESKPLPHDKPITKLTGASAIIGDNRPSNVIYPDLAQQALDKAKRIQLKESAILKGFGR